ncbi:type II secretion system protein [Photobacterium lipolyticum]|uniref:MSHA biogenesis protein MshA n=1 Tax=Photobacterium lipolyticum TaxID=266810 RepID=A0A2T3N4L1_9GAMM|nr:type II secretion system protein [Photobacterium lipolyticum]PSW07334.1 MSHA biogenesis protein MshA [Photobacterium lipolyticum]
MFNETAKKQGGFTLIELVTVIVILGVLAVTAAPKFMNLQSDARKSTLSGMKGAMSAAITQVYGLSALAGTDHEESAKLLVSGEDVSTVYGYPKSDFKNAWSKILNAEFGEVPYDDATKHEWMWHNPGGKGLYIMPRGYSNKSQSCWVMYFHPVSKATSTYQLNSEDSGC